jgi:hypothetical protein
MARLKGLLKIEGTLDELTFYKTQDGHLVKTKSGVSADRIANDPTFQRTRENGSEFGSSASAGKLLRDCVRSLMMTAADNRVTSRVTQVMTIIKNFDTTSARGDRSVGVGIADPMAQAELKNFDFNISAILSSILYKPYTVNTATGIIGITGLVPVNDIAYPTGSIHVAIRGAWAKIDFAGNTSEIEYTNIVNLPIDGTSGTVTLTPAAIPAGAGTSLFFLAIEFFQEVNGVQYTLKNGAYNSLSIVEVA